MTKANDMAAVAAALSEKDRFLVTSHEAPDGDALGSLLAMGLACARSGRTRSCSSAGRRPCPASTASSSSPDAASSGRCRRRRAGPRRARLREREPGRRRAGPRGARVLHGQRRPPPRQPALRRREPRRRGGVVDRRGARRPLPRARRRAYAGDRRGLYIALVTDTGRFQYANTTPKALASRRSSWRRART